jgi:hypothetical protein
MERRTSNPDRRTRVFMNSTDADAFANQMGPRVTSMAYGTDSVKVTFRSERFADVMPQSMPKFEGPKTATPFNTSGSISFQESQGRYGTK